MLSRFLSYFGAFALAVVVLGLAAIAGRAFLPASVVSMASPTVGQTPTANVLVTSPRPLQTASNATDYRALASAQRVRVDEVRNSMMAAMESDAAESAYLAPQNILRMSGLLGDAREQIGTFPQSGTVGAARKRYLAALELMEEAHHLGPRFYTARIFDIFERAYAEWRAGDDAL